MTPDELRALADALLPMAAAPCFDGIDVERAADYLRAQADAQPVAWIKTTHAGVRRLEWNKQTHYANDDYPAITEPLFMRPAPQPQPNPAMLESHRRWVEQAIHDAEHPSGMSTHDGKARIDASILHRMLTIIDSLPAAPQAEPKRDWSAIDAAIREYLDGYEQIGENDAGADACYTPTERELYLIYDAINGLLADESFVAAISASQAGPKREPLTYEQMRAVLIAEARWIAAQAGEKDPDSLAVDEEMLAQVMLAGRAVERAHGIGGSDAE